MHAANDEKCILQYLYRSTAVGLDDFHVCKQLYDIVSRSIVVDEKMIVVLYDIIVSKYK